MVSDQKPLRFDAVLEDKILYWMRGSHDGDIRCVVSFEGRVDVGRLDCAARLCLVAEPVLASRFVRHWKNPHWEMADSAVIEEHGGVKVIETPADRQELEKFLVQTPATELFVGPQVRFFLLRGPQNDTLLIRINHVAGDGGGLKDTVALLGRIYSTLEDNPGFRPTPSNPLQRGLRPVFSRFRWKDHLGIFGRSLKDAAEFMSPPRWFFKSLAKRDLSCSTLVTRHIEKERFGAIVARAKEYGATVNDAFVAAHLTALNKVLTPGRRPRLVITADLRRFLESGRAQGVCNLSGFFYLDMDSQASQFEPCLKQVTAKTSGLKNDYLALGNFPLTAAAFAALPFPLAIKFHDFLGDLQKKQCQNASAIAPLFTNTGTMDGPVSTFRGAKAKNAFITTTVAHPPVLSLCLSGFGGGLNLTAGFCADFLARQQVEAFLDQLEEELPD
ncbi:MAG: hypothetical protein QMD09_07295 [Desulfatibacillaceae bacterium]|nr:hypothetical protein [Desulfatibacillaceae bacterium]